jgi:hypothetical protein
VYCLPFITSGCPSANTGLTTVGYHSNATMPSGSISMETFDHRCKATNTRLLTLGYHATRQYRVVRVSMEPFDHGCIVTTASSQTRHNIFMIPLIPATPTFGPRNHQDTSSLPQMYLAGIKTKLITMHEATWSGPFSNSISPLLVKKCPAGMIQYAQREK